MEKLDINIVRNYLKTSRRLTIPKLGSFIVKNDGKIIFSELLQTDDGVLVHLLMDSGYPELAAAAIIDSFVFDVKSSLADGGYCRLGQFGTMHRTAEGVITFNLLLSEPEPVAKPAAVAEQSSPAERVAAPAPVRPPRKRPQGKYPTQRNLNYNRRSGFKMDRFVLFAIIVATLAIGLVVYYTYVAPSPRMFQDEQYERVDLNDVQDIGVQEPQSDNIPLGESQN